MVAFATAEDVRLRWSGAPEDDAQINGLLEDATSWLQVLYPTIPSQPSGKLAGVLRIVVCAMVKRSLLAEENEHLDSLNQSAGDYSENRSFRNSEGNLFLTRQEREMLDKALAQETGTPRGMRTVEATGW